MIPTTLQVALGGALGASARYLTGLMMVRLLGHGFPYGTLTVNVVGSLAMGVFAGAAAHKGLTHLSPFLMTGVLGGFTTFSAFSLDTMTLIERGQTGLALAYVGLSVLLSVGGLALGLTIARGVFA